jgi:transposase-like protein
MKLPATAKKVEVSVEETLEYMAFPREHWRKVRNNNAIGRLLAAKMTKKLSNIWGSVQYEHES